MTDKQIIIDGVDVSECRFYSEKLSTMKGTGSISTIKCNGFCTHNIRGLDDSSCYDAHIEYAKCKNNNCYYKQLKAKEQECEELKATLKVIADRPCLNINDCNGNCLPHCKWNAHKLAQEALKGSE